MPFSIGFFYTGICLNGFGLANVAAYQYSDTDPAFTDCLIDCDCRTSIPKPCLVSLSKPDCHCSIHRSGANLGCHHLADCHAGPGDEYYCAASHLHSDSASGSN